MAQHEAEWEVFVRDPTNVTVASPASPELAWKCGQQTIKPASTFELAVPVLAAGALVTYRFGTDEFDIGFGIEFLRTVFARICLINVFLQQSSPLSIGPRIHYRAL